MLRRDYLVKQFEEFGKVLAVLMGLKREGKYPELNTAIQEAALKYTGLEIEALEQAKEEGFAEYLAITKHLSDEQLKMSADLLYEKAEAYLAADNIEKAHHCYRRAYRLYQYVQDKATLPYSLDVHYKLEFMKRFFTNEGGSL